MQAQFRRASGAKCDLGGLLPTNAFRVHCQRDQMTFCRPTVRAFDTRDKGADDTRHQRGQMTTDPTAAANAIIQRIRTEPVPNVTAEDAVVLEAVPERTLMMDKLLAIHYNQAGDMVRALDAAERIFAKEKTSESVKNVGLLLRKLKRYDEASEFCTHHRDLYDPIDWNDTMAMIRNETGDTDGAAQHGTRSLELKDAACESAPELKPVKRTFNREEPRRNIITFSLWGQDPRYLSGAMKNVVVARYLYPGWTPRFYIDESVPQAARDYILQQGGQLVLAPKEWPADRFGLFWRFLVEDDPDVDFFMVRDADSVMNIKERAAVEDWLASGRTFHLMRDLPTHSELILAGMWAAQRGNIGTMSKRVQDHVTGGQRKLGNRITDQEFLRWKIWPIVRQDVMAHDAYLDFGNPTRYRDEFHLPARLHIGQNDFIHQRARKLRQDPSNADRN